MPAIHPIVDEGLGNSAYGSGTAGPPPGRVRRAGGPQD
jgi:hypothetical protein